MNIYIYIYIYIYITYRERASGNCLRSRVFERRCFVEIADQCSSLQTAEQWWWCWQRRWLWLWGNICDAINVSL